MANEDDMIAYLKSIDQGIATIRQLVTEGLGAMRAAEVEIPESIRRFANYYHDVVHIKGEYVSLGIQPPKWVDQEMERCHDRFRQVLLDLHSDDGAFAKVRREMAKDPKNRYDHTRQLTKGEPSETGNG